MSNLNRVVVNGPKTNAIEYSLFISVVAIIAIAALDATGGSLNTMYTLVADAMQAAIAA
jgi:Flp pilus assembly pilin Flp